MTRHHAAAITRALRDLTAARLTTTTVDRPTGTLSGWRVTTTPLLTRQLDQALDGHLLVKRRVADALGLDDTMSIGVSIDAHRATIDIVAPTPSPSNYDRKRPT